MLSLILSLLVWFMPMPVIPVSDDGFSDGIVAYRMPSCRGGVGRGRVCWP